MISRYDQGMTAYREPIHRNLPAMESLACEVMNMSDARDYLATASPLAVITARGRRYARLSVSEKIERKLLSAAPVLACAVIDLIAQLNREQFAHTSAAIKLKRVEELADRLDREASEVLGRPTCSQAGDRIRAALNGGNA